MPFNLRSVLLSALCASAGACLQAQTSIEIYGGSHGSWPTAWVSLPSLNDPVDAAVEGKLDFVGDAANPGAYWAVSPSYVYFRIRVNTPTVTLSTYADTLFIMVDRIGFGNAGKPDYSFGWDSKGVGNNHGLEMNVLPANSTASTWGDLQMNDVDGSPGLKTAPPDFSLTGGDGYLRAVTGLGTDSFIDWAISLDYLVGKSGTGLGPDQTWSIALASIRNATDHNVVNADVAGGAGLGSPLGSGWSAQILLQPIPEPSVSVLFVGAGMAWIGHQIRGCRRRTMGRCPPCAGGIT